MLVRIFATATEATAAARPVDAAAGEPSAADPAAAATEPSQGAARQVMPPCKSVSGFYFFITRGHDCKCNCEHEHEHEHEYEHECECVPHRIPCAETLHKHTVAYTSRVGYVSEC